MAIGIGNNYELMQSLYNSSKTGRSDRASKAPSSEEAKSPKKVMSDKTEDVQLSDKAKDLLESLKKKYGNMDFFIAKTDSEEEASEIMSRGTKEFSVLLDPDELEKMAEDEEEANRVYGILDNAGSAMEEIRTSLGDDADQITRIGFSFDSEGKVSYFAELEKMSEKQQERIEKSIEDRKAAKKEAEKADEKKAAEKLKSDKVKRTRVEASSIEELTEKIKNVNWDEIEAERKLPPMAGAKFDLSI
ncbi:MAG: hypothetical protein J6P05_05275 [Lachnospiraceae bacterium]|nr:hypothetical protein [Lachnospiraceae bacterium]